MRQMTDYEKYLTALNGSARWEPDGEADQLVLAVARKDRGTSGVLGCGAERARTRAELDEELKRLKGPGGG